MPSSRQGEPLAEMGLQCICFRAERLHEVRLYSYRTPDMSHGMCVCLATTLYTLIAFPKKPDRNTGSYETMVKTPYTNPVAFKKD